MDISDLCFYIFNTKIYTYTTNKVNESQTQMIRRNILQKIIKLRILNDIFFTLYISTHFEILFSNTDILRKLANIKDSHSQIAGDEVM